MLCKERIWFIMGALWVCFIICPLWQWVLWQFVLLELFVCCLVVDFCLMGRNLDSKRKRDRERTGGTRGWAARILATLYTSYSQHTHTHNRDTFPLLDAFNVVHTHTNFCCLTSPHILTIINKKNLQSLLLYSYVTIGTNIFTKNWWLSDCHYIFVSVV